MATALRRRGVLFIKPILSSSSPSLTTSSSVSRSFSSHLCSRDRSVISLTDFQNRFPSTTILDGATLKYMSTHADTATVSSLNDLSKQTLILDGCDYKHWLIVMEKPQGTLGRDEIIDSYIKTLSKVIGSEEEARMKIYSVSTVHYFAFGALVSEELSNKIKELPGVRWVMPDSYLDVKNKEYGGEPFINGKAVPYDPKYHLEWIRNTNPVGGCRPCRCRSPTYEKREKRVRDYSRPPNLNMRHHAQNIGGDEYLNMPNKTADIIYKENT